jgi:phage-related protein
LYKKIRYRLFAFWDKSDNTDTIVVATHGLIKKTDKTPQTDLAKAEELRREYFENEKIEEYEDRKEDENVLSGRHYR